MKSSLTILVCLVVIATVTATKGDEERPPNRWEDLTLEQQHCFIRGYNKASVADRRRLLYCKATGGGRECVEGIEEVANCLY